MGKTIHTALGSLQKVELEDIKHFFGAKVSSSARKDEFVRMLTNYIKTEPMSWLTRMLERDLRLLQKIVKAGRGGKIVEEYPDYPSVLETVKLIDTDTSDENFITLSINSELYSVVAPWIDDAIDFCESNGTFLLERTAMGLLNLYGALPFEDFIDFMWNIMYDALESKGEEGGQEAFDMFIDNLYEMPLVKLCTFDYPQGRYITSPMVADPEKLIKAIDSHKDEISGFKTFDLQTIIDAGTGAPYCVCGLKSAQGTAIMKVLDRLGYEGDALIMTLHDVWMDSQTVVDEGSTEALLNCVSRHQDEIPSFAEYRKSMQAVVDYANSLPRWELKGSSADDTGILKIELKVDEELYSSKTDGSLYSGEEIPVPEFVMPEPTVSEGFAKALEAISGPDMIATMFAMPHVAADDPCPCGSGLKYRHCHGKNLS